VQNSNSILKIGKNLYMFSELLSTRKQCENTSFLKSFPFIKYYFESEIISEKFE